MTVGRQTFQKIQRLHLKIEQTNFFVNILTLPLTKLVSIVLSFEGSTV